MLKMFNTSPTKWLMVGCVVALNACSSGNGVFSSGKTTRPVTCVNNFAQGKYCVQSGDNLNIISQKTGTSVVDIMSLNRMGSGVVYVGQLLRIHPTQTPASVADVANHDETNPTEPSPSAPPAVAENTSTGIAPEVQQFTAPPPTVAETTPAPQLQEPNITAPTGANGLQFMTPVKGKIVTEFDGKDNKGIAIATDKGTPVLAAAAGTVIYAGNNITGYGNLLLIRHNMSTITAYANNEKLLVKENDGVKVGQPIATVGNSGNPDKPPALHFEVRIDGKAVNPYQFIK